MNLHLYGLDLAMGGVLLPEHELAIIDEAHQLEDIVSATCGIELTGGRFADLARRVRGVIADDQLPAGVDDAGRLLSRGAAPAPGPAPQGRAARRRRRRAHGGTRAGWSPCSTAARNVPERRPRGDAHPRRPAGAVRRARSSRTSALVERVTANEVMWVEGTDANPVLRVAPLDVADLLPEMLWDKRTAVLTSATLPAAAPDPARAWPTAQITELDVGSPFDYEAHALLYCAAPPPRPAAPRRTSRRSPTSSAT